MGALKHDLLKNSKTTNYNMDIDYWYIMISEYQNSSSVCHILMFFVCIYVVLLFCFLLFDYFFFG